MCTCRIHCNGHMDVELVTHLERKGIHKEMQQLSAHLCHPYVSEADDQRSYCFPRT